MAEAGAIARDVLADQVKDRLLQDILAGRYAPDSRIVETRVARELGTSQAPVREALRGLEALGLVAITPFRGARVRRPTSEELIGAYAVRSELESLGARLAVPRLTALDLADLSELNDQMQRAAARGDVHEVATADALFHGRLVSAAGNGTLTRIWSSLEPFSRTYLTLLIPAADAHWTADLHPPILDALRAGDAERAVTALVSHFTEARSQLTRGWSDSAGEAGGANVDDVPAPAHRQAARAGPRKARPSRRRTITGANQADVPR